MSAFLLLFSFFPYVSAADKLENFCLIGLSVFSLEDAPTIFIFTRVDVYEAESWVDLTAPTSGPRASAVS